VSVVFLSGTITETNNDERAFEIKFLERITFF